MPMPIKLKLLRPVLIDYKISSPFGMRTHPLTGRKKLHRGIDFECPVNTPIRAMVAGRIFKCGWQDPKDPRIGLGYRVWQESEINGKIIYLWYGHLNQLFGGFGQKLKLGDFIGTSGSTGAVSGPHLHIQDRTRDTGTYLNMDFYEELLEGKNAANIRD